MLVAHVRGPLGAHALGDRLERQPCLLQQPLEDRPDLHASNLAGLRHKEGCANLAQAFLYRGPA